MDSVSFPVLNLIFYLYSYYIYLKLTVTVIKHSLVRSATFNLLSSFVSIMPFSVYGFPTFSRAIDYF